MTNLGSFGTTEATYARRHARRRDGLRQRARDRDRRRAAAVCVWVTTSTLGVTEFFDGGPEVLTVAQSKGAEDTVALRASVETRKS